MYSFLFVTWDVNPEIFNIGGYSLRYYSVLFVTGLLLCWFILNNIYKKEGISENTFNKLFIYCFLGIVLGARLGHCLFYQPDYFLKHPLEIILPFSFHNGKFKFTGYQGLASHGGALGLIIALILYSRRTGQNIVKTLDYIATVTPLSACFIRLGNLMNSEIIGKATDVRWAFIFVHVDNIPRHPAQLYEAIAYFIFFIITIVIYLLYRRNMNPGFMFGLTLTLIFLFRFFVEFLKERQVDFEGSMTLDMGQLLSIPFILIGIYFMFFFKRSKKE
jgi:phosphatidylglycerol:prolipoprotein diacylglycerol transferase